MKRNELRAELEAFARARSFRGKGPLSVALVVTDQAKKRGLPINPEDLLTEGRGQVRGLGKGAVQAILARHGISRVLAAEGGRTSRGSIGNMQEYVAFLNRLAKQGQVDLDEVERFWIEQVRLYFAGQPFRIRMDAALGLRALVRDLLAQAEQRQKETPGMNCAGAVLQHLVGAKLECALGKGKVEHHRFSTADAPTGRAGDFLIGDVAIHVTTSPGEGLIAKCRKNLDSGLRPVIVTLERSVAVADGLARNAGIAHRIDVFEIEQFVALNLYELGWTTAKGRKTAVEDFVEAYNEIVQRVETDPSLKISLRS